MDVDNQLRWIIMLAVATTLTVAALFIFGLPATAQSPWETQKEWKYPETTTPRVHDTYNTNQVEVTPGWEYYYHKKNDAHNELRRTNQRRRLPDNTIQIEEGPFNGSSDWDMRLNQ